MNSSGTRWMENSYLQKWKVFLQNICEYPFVVYWI